jgi:hypothetical protein
MSRRLTLIALVVASLLVPTATLAAARLWPMSSWNAASPASAALTLQDEGVMQSGEGVTLPSIAREVHPNYTPGAMQARIEDDVLLAIVVQADGTVGRTRAVKSLDTVHGLDEEAMPRRPTVAVRPWAQGRTSRARRSGTAVYVHTPIVEDQQDLAMPTVIMTS